MQESARRAALQRQLTAALISVGVCGAPAAVAADDAAPAPSSLVETGRALFDLHGCANCHSASAAAEGGVVVPLDDLALRYTPSLLAELLAEPPPEMPRFALSSEERRALAAYLLRSER